MATINRNSSSINRGNNIINNNNNNSSDNNNDNHNNNTNNNNEPDYNFSKYEHILSAFRMLKDMIIMCPECPKSGPREAFSCEYDFQSHMKEKHLNQILDINLPSDVLEVCMNHSAETADMNYDNIESYLKSEINDVIEDSFAFSLSSSSLSLSASALPDSQSNQSVLQSTSSTNDPKDSKLFVKSYERYGQIKQFNILIYKLPILKAAHAAYFNGTCQVDQANIDKVRKWVINAVFNQLSTEYFQYAIPDYIAHLVCATIVCTYPVLQDDTALKYQELYCKLLTKYANYRKRSQLQLSSVEHKKRNAPLQAIINAKKKRDDIRNSKLNNRIDDILMDEVQDHQDESTSDSDQPVFTSPRINVNNLVCDPKSSAESPEALNPSSTQGPQLSAMIDLDLSTNSLYDVTLSNDTPIVVPHLLPSNIHNAIKKSNLKVGAEQLPYIRYSKKSNQFVFVIDKYNIPASILINAQNLADPSNDLYKRDISTLNKALRLYIVSPLVNEFENVFVGKPKARYVQEIAGKFSSLSPLLAEHYDKLASDTSVWLSSTIEKMLTNKFETRDRGTEGKQLKKPNLSAKLKEFNLSKRQVEKE